MVVISRLAGLVACGLITISSALALSSNRVQVISSYHNDVSRPLRELATLDVPQARQDREAAENPKIPNSHIDSPDRVIQRGSVLQFLAPNIPAPILNFDGIPFPGVGCNCAPPDTNGAVGATQYVQMVNEGYQVFDKRPATRFWVPTVLSHSGMASAERVRPADWVIRW